MSARHPALGARRGGARCYGPTPGAGCVSGAQAGYDLRSLRRFFGFGELLAFWELWNPDIVNYTMGPGELLVDGNGEAPGVGAWTAINGAVLTKEVFNPYEGLRYLRVAYNGSAAPSAAQVILAPGARYLVVARMRPSGAAVTPRIQDSGTALWTGVPGGGWQLAVAEFTALTTELRFRAICGTPAGDYVDVDAATVIELPGIVRCPNILNPGTYDLAFPLGAQQAWLHPTAWLGAHPAAQFDGVGHFGESHALALEYAGVDNPLGVFTTAGGLTWGANRRLWALGKSTAVSNESHHSVYMSVGPNRFNSARKDQGGTTKYMNGAMAPASEFVHAYNLANGTTGSSYLDAAADGGPTNQDLGDCQFDRLYVGAQIFAGGITNFIAGNYRELAWVRVTREAQALALSRRLAHRNFLP